MREIKFRFWDSRTNSWCDSENWLPSTVRFGVNETFAFANKDGIIAQQYTGLKDKNGVEIYEGDLASWWHHEYMDGKPATVVWNEEKGWQCVWYSYRDYPYFVSNFDIEDDESFRASLYSYANSPPILNFKVVGNIFEGVDK